MIFGVIALAQIKKRNQNGKGMAIAGLVLSAVKPSKETSVKVETLKTGDCVNDLKETGKCFDILDAYLPSIKGDQSIRSLLCAPDPFLVESG